MKNQLIILQFIDNNQNANRSIIEDTKTNTPIGTINIKHSLKQDENKLATTNLKADFSFPNVSLNQSMGKYQRQARNKIELSKIVEEISSTVFELIDKFLHQKIFSEITRIINEVLCIREELSTSSKQGSTRQQQINQQMKRQIKRIKNKIQQMTFKSSSLSFQSFFKPKLSQKHSVLTSNTKGEGIEYLVNDIYQFLQRNQGTNLFNECQKKIEKMEDLFKQSNEELSKKIEELKRKQKPFNQNLRKQLNEALCKQNIDREIKKSLKENIRYLHDELIRSRKQLQQVKEQMKQLSQRQRELQFSQTLLQHKII